MRGLGCVLWGAFSKPTLLHLKVGTSGEQTPGEQMSSNILLRGSRRLLIFWTPSDAGSHRTRRHEDNKYRSLPMNCVYYYIECLGFEKTFGSTTASVKFFSGARAAPIQVEPAKRSHQERAPIPQRADSQLFPRGCFFRRHSTSEGSFRRHSTSGGVFQPPFRAALDRYYTLEALKLSKQSNLPPAYPAHPAGLSPNIKLRIPPGQGAGPCASRRAYRSWPLRIPPGL